MAVHDCDPSTYVLEFLLLSWKYHDPQQLEEESQSTEENQGRNSNGSGTWRQGAGTEVMEGSCLLACSYGLLSLLSHRTQDSDIVLPTMGGALPYQSQLKTISDRFTYSNFSVEVPSSQMALACVKLT